jgi:hypothetical protein
LLLAPSEVDGERVPWAYVVPRGIADLIGMGRSFAKTMLLSAGNITHTPAEGNLIALGARTAVQSRNVSQQQVAEAMAYRGSFEPAGFSPIAAALRSLVGECARTRATGSR